MAGRPDVLWVPSPLACNETACPSSPRADGRLRRAVDATVADRPRRANGETDLPEGVPGGIADAQDRGIRTAASVVVTSPTNSRVTTCTRCCSLLVIVIVCLICGD